MRFCVNPAITMDINDCGGRGGPGAIMSSPTEYGMTSGLVSVAAAIRNKTVFHGYRRTSEMCAGIVDDIGDGAILPSASHRRF
jgi:hypothetical protein